MNISMCQWGFYLLYGYFLPQQKFPASKLQSQDDQQRSTETPETYIAPALIPIPGLVNQHSYGKKRPIELDYLLIFTDYMLCQSTNCSVSMKTFGFSVPQDRQIWLVLWNMTGLFFPSYWACNHPI